MQFNNRSILLAAAALVFAQSAVTAPSQELAERAASTGYTGPGVYTINNVATGTRVSLYRSGVNDGTPIVGSHNDTDSHQQWRIDEPTSLGGAFKSMTNVATGKLIAAQATLPPPNSVNTLTAQSVPSSYNNQNLYKVWLITAPLGDGSYDLVNGMYWKGKMDLSHSDPADETPILCYTSTNAPNQHWFLNRIGN